MSTSTRILSRHRARAVRRRRIRARVRGTPERPRLSVFRSARHVSVQLVDDTASRTLLGLSDIHVPRGAGKEAAGTPGVVRAFSLGQLVAERARALGVSRVVFDRGGYAYHGQVKAVAEGARAGGLEL